MKTNELINEYVKNLGEYGTKELTQDDIEQAMRYMMEIPCRDIEQTCGTHIGCSTCPYHRFQITVIKAFEKLLKGEH